MTSAKGALQAIADLSRRNGGLSINLMRRVVVAAVTSIALFGAEVWWKGQKDLERRLQLLINSQARAIIGLLKSTPIAFLLETVCLPYARDLLDQRQSCFAVRALRAAQDHPTHQLLPTNFRFGELYRHEAATGLMSSVGWTRPDKAHRRFGSRMAQQVSKHVTYDTEHRFDLLEKDKLGTPVGADVDSRLQMLLAIHRFGPNKMTMVASAAKATSFGAAVGWVANNRHKVKSDSLGRYLTMLDAELCAIRMAIRIYQTSLPELATRCVEILSDSRQALSTVGKASYWTPPAVRDIKHQFRFIQERGDQVTLSQLPTDENIERTKLMTAAAKLAAAQQPKVMRSASLSYVTQSIKARWKPAMQISKVISSGRKPVTARYLQLKSGHAVTGVYLLRTKQAQDARCWWCNSSEETSREVEG